MSSALGKATRWGGARISRRLVRSIPFLGAVVVFATVASTVRRKGAVGGLADTGLNAIPYVGALKNLVEFVRGEDFFRDRPIARRRAEHRTTGGRHGFAVFLLVAIAPQARAIDDLSGVWTGAFTCGVTSETFTEPKAKADATLHVEDLGNGNGRARFNNATVSVVPVTIVSGADEPAQARLAGVMCGFTADTGGSLIQGLAKVKPGSQKGTIKGELVTYGGGGAPLISVCGFKVKRTGPLEAPLGDCPP